MVNSTRQFSRKCRLLCRYTSATRGLETLESGMFYFADWKEFNDPMEGFYWHSVKSLKDDYLIFLEKSSFGICSFSKSSHNVLMWSHYADGHTGLCIQVEKPSFLPTEMSINKVTYSSTIPKLPDSSNAISIARYILTNKLTLWQYENEIRVLFHFPNEIIPQQARLRQFGHIEKVILGVRSNSDTERQVVKLAIEKGIKVERAYLNFSRNIISHSAIERPRSTEEPDLY